jgi:hypothetical protein
VRDALRTRATFDWSPSRQDGRLPALDGGTFPLGNFDTIDKQQNYTASGNADWVATSKLYVGMRAGYFTNNHTTANVIEQPLFVFMRTNIGYLDVPISLQQAGGFQDRSDKLPSAESTGCRASNAQIDATYFGSLAGHHMLKAGVQFDRRSNDVDRGQSCQPDQPVWNAAIAGPARSVTATTACSAIRSIPSAARSLSATFHDTSSACSCRTPGRWAAG